MDEANNGEDRDKTENSADNKDTVASKGSVAASSEWRRQQKITPDYQNILSSSNKPEIWFKRVLKDPACQTAVGLKGFHLSVQQRHPTRWASFLPGLNPPSALLSLAPSPPMSP